MPQRTEPNGFDAVVLPHLDAVFNLARWMLRNLDDAEEVVQEAALRAFIHYRNCRGTSPRAWLLRIVRNVALTRLRTQHQVVPLVSRDADDAELEPVDPADSPEALMLRGEELREVDRVLTRLPMELRETVVLCEIVELSYKEVAQITGVPLGTVMSRLGVLADAWKNVPGRRPKHDPEPRDAPSSQPSVLAYSGRYHEFLNGSKVKTEKFCSVPIE